MAAAEACGPSWALGIAREETVAAKNPKVIAEVLAWAREAVVGFGNASPVDPVQLALLTIEHRDKGVRDAAAALLLAVRHAIGPAMLALPQLSALKESARKALEEGGAALDAKGERQPAPSRVFKHAPTAAAGAGAAAGGGGAASALDDLLPRVDLADKLGAANVARLKDPNWKERKEVLRRGWLGSLGEVGLVTRRGCLTTAGTFQ